MKDKIILILGTFNPPTMAHVKMSHELHRDYPDAKICYVVSSPSYVEKWKTHQMLIRANIRTQLLLDNIDSAYTFISLFENTEESDGTTITTARHFRKRGYDVSLCIGSDNVSKIPEWHEGLTLAKEFKFIVIHRNDEGKEVLPEELKPFASNFTFKKYELPPTSASDIRAAVLADKLDSLKDDIPQNVYQFMRRHQKSIKAAQKGESSCQTCTFI